jgi:hypothetical protein
MQMRRRFKQISSLSDRLIQQAQNLRQQADGMPASVRRDELLRKARQAETTANVDELLSSPSLQPPR